MKFPLLANAFGRQKLILEIGGNTVGLSSERYAPQQHRRRRVQPAPMDFRTDKHSGPQLSGGV